MSTPSIQNTLTLDTLTIRQDYEGRYCLNDLHAASGGEEKHSANRYFRSDAADGLINALLEAPDLAFEPLKIVRGGAHKGTYVVRELVYAYAMWISPQFHLKVIRAYDRLATQGVAVHEDKAEDV